MKSIQVIEKKFEWCDVTVGRLARYCEMEIPDGVYLRGGVYRPYNEDEDPENVFTFRGESAWRVLFEFFDLLFKKYTPHCEIYYFADIEFYGSETNDVNHVFFDYNVVELNICTDDDTMKYKTFNSTKEASDFILNEIKKESNPDPDVIKKLKENENVELHSLIEIYEKLTDCNAYVRTVDVLGGKDDAFNPIETDKKFISDLIQWRLNLIKGSEKEEKDEKNKESVNN